MAKNNIDYELLGKVRSQVLKDLEDIVKEYKVHNFNHPDYKAISEGNDKEKGFFELSFRLYQDKENTPEYWMFFTRDSSGDYYEIGGKQGVIGDPYADYADALNAFKELI